MWCFNMVGAKSNGAWLRELSCSNLFFYQCQSSPVAKKPKLHYCEGNKKTLSYWVEAGAVGMIEASNGHFFDCETFPSGLD